MRCPWDRVPQGSSVPALMPCSFILVFLCFGCTIPCALKRELPKGSNSHESCPHRPFRYLLTQQSLQLGHADSGIKEHWPQVKLKTYHNKQWESKLLWKLCACLFSAPSLSWLRNAKAALLHQLGSIYILALFQETHKINTLIWWFRHWPSTKPKAMPYLLCVR